MQKVISEFGKIYKKTDFENETDSFSAVYLAENEFESLKKIIFKEKNDAIFGFSIKKGNEQIQIKNFVGVIENGKLQLEILPKIGFENTQDAKIGLLKMLKSLSDLPFKIFNESHLKNSQISIFEIFITAFLDELEKLFLQGQIKHFERIETNEFFVKGKLNVSENIKKNIFHNERFSIIYDDFTTNIPLNRIIKNCLQYLDNQSTHSKNKLKIRQFLQVFEDVDFSQNLEKDFAEIIKLGRQFQAYHKLLTWTKIFLQHQSFTPFSGKTLQTSLLFPTEILFEKYIALAFKKYLSEKFEIKIQNNTKHLINSHLDKPKFRIVPDILLENREKKIIFDTKWKLIDATKPKQNYNIEQSDLYQMYAYGKKYACKQLFLVYPAHKNFKNPLQVFDYEQDLQLYVIPFDLKNDLSSEMLKIENLVEKSA